MSGPHTKSRPARYCGCGGTFRTPAPAPKYDHKTIEKMHEQGLRVPGEQIFARDFYAQFGVNWEDVRTGRVRFFPRK